MSQLESAVKSTLTRLVRGESFEVTPVEQRVVELWALKTLMVWEFAYRTPPYFRSAERTALMQKDWHRLPSYYVVAGDYRGQAFKAVARPIKSRFLRAGGEETGVPTMTGVLIIGQLILIVLADRYKETTGRDCVAFQKPGYERTEMLDGGGAPLKWPPPRPIDDEVLKTLAGVSARPTT